MAILDQDWNLLSWLWERGETKYLGRYYGLKWADCSTNYNSNSGCFTTGIVIPKYLEKSLPHCNFCPLQISPGLSWEWAQVSTIRSRQLPQQWHDLLPEEINTVQGLQWMIPDSLLHVQGHLQFIPLFYLFMISIQILCDLSLVNLTMLKNKSCMTRMTRRETTQQKCCILC
jgi:hypothetical protein